MSLVNLNVGQPMFSSGASTTSVSTGTYTLPPQQQAQWSLYNQLGQPAGLGQGTFALGQYTTPVVRRTMGMDLASSASRLQNKLGAGLTANLTQGAIKHWLACYSPRYQKRMHQLSDLIYRGKLYKIVSWANFDWENRSREVSR